MSSQRAYKPRGGSVTAGLDTRATAALRRTVAAATESYVRDRDLPRLIGWDPFSDFTESEEAVAALVTRLRRALRAERARARAGHWTYDLNRHIALRRAYAAETQRLAVLRG